MTDINAVNAPVQKSTDVDMLREDFSMVKSLAYIIYAISEIYLTSLSSEQLEKIAREEKVKIPIMDEDLIANLRLVGEEYWPTFYLALCELGSFANIAVDVILNDNECSPDTVHFRTPYILTIETYEPDLLDDDDGGGDDDDSEDDPVGEKRAPMKTMAMAAGAGGRR